MNEEQNVITETVSAWEKGVSKWRENHESIPSAFIQLSKSIDNLKRFRADYVPDLEYGCSFEADRETVNLLYPLPEQTSLDILSNCVRRIQENAELFSEVLQQLQGNAEGAVFFHAEGLSLKVGDVFQDKRVMSLAEVLERLKVLGVPEGAWDGITDFFQRALDVVMDSDCNYYWVRSY